MTIQPITTTEAERATRALQELGRVAHLAGLNLKRLIQACNEMSLAMTIEVKETVIKLDSARPINKPWYRRGRW